MHFLAKYRPQKSLRLPFVADKMKYQNTLKQNLKTNMVQLLGQSSRPYLRVSVSQQWVNLSIKWR
jgi:hypothetical protein